MDNPYAKYLPQQQDEPQPPSDQPPADTANNPYAKYAGEQSARGPLKLTVRPPGVEAPPTEQPPTAPKHSYGEAALEGGLSGLSANFRDEIYGASKASGLPEFLGGFRAPVGAARLGYEAVTGQSDGEATKAYNEAVALQRARQKEIQKEYPGTYLAGQVVGGIALPGGAATQAATLPARALRTGAVGAGYGAVFGAGEGENLSDRASHAATGAGAGLVLGTAAPYAIRGAQEIARGVAAATRPLTNTLRGMVNPEAEASRRVVGALERDQRVGDAGLSPQEWAQAHGSGKPVGIADMGGQATQALARSAANTSPEGRSAIQSFADQRFEGQTDRASDFIRNLVGGRSLEPDAIREANRAAARPVNNRAYTQAFAEHDGPLWNETLEFLSQDAVMQGAIRRASVDVRTDRTLQGYSPFNQPFTFEPSSGRLMLGRDRNGNVVYPDLQFWDRVKRQLDQQNTRESSAFARTLRDQLDHATTNQITGRSSYQEARAGAARFFGADDAVTAGQNFTRSSMSQHEARRAIAQFTPEEMQLFQQGYAAELLRAVQNTSDRADVMRKLARNPEQRERLGMVFGPQGLQNIVAYATVERTMDRLRGAVQGNSTTARQLAEIGLAGGSGFLDVGDMGMTPTALLTYGLLRGQRHINQNVAQRVARMLTSDDSAVLARGYQMVARNQGLLRAFENTDQALSKFSGQQGPGHSPALQLPAPGRAEDGRKEVPGP